MTMFAGSATNRPILYIGMAPLTRAQYEPFFAKIPLYQSSDVVRSFVADVNGHPRTLIAVLDMLLSGTVVEPTRPSLLEELRCRLGRALSDFAVPAEVIIKALLQQEVSLNTLTVPGGLPYSYYVAMVRNVTS
jgi:hypothetical protein